MGAGGFMGKRGFLRLFWPEGQSVWRLGYSEINGRNCFVPSACALAHVKLHIMMRNRFRSSRSGLSTDMFQVLDYNTMMANRELFFRTLLKEEGVSVTSFITLAHASLQTSKK